MAGVKTTGLDNLGKVIDGRLLEARNNFNKKLDLLVDAWLKAASNTYYVKGGVSSFKNITEVQHLSREKGGARRTIKARVIFTVIALPLTDFSVTQQRLAKGKMLASAKSDKGRFSESKIGKFTSYDDTFTKARLLKRTKEHLVVIAGSKIKALSGASGLKGFMYSPTNRVDAKPETPLGVYVRLQEKTWAGNKRLPIYKLYSPPLAVVMFSKRVMQAARINERLEELKNV